MSFKFGLKTQLLALCAVLALSQAAPAQKKDKDKWTNDVAAVLEKNTPTVNFVNEEGWETQVQMVKYKDAPALKFLIFHHHSSRFSNYKGCKGHLFVSAERVAYQTDEESEHSWDVARSELNKINVIAKHGVLELRAPSMREGKSQQYINAAREKRAFEWYWWDNGYKRTDNMRMIELAMTDFNAALAKFKELAADVLVADEETAAAAKKDEPVTKEALYERFAAAKKSDPKAAYDIARDYVRKFPDADDENTRTLKTWMSVYEKLKQ